MNKKEIVTVSRDVGFLGRGKEQRMETVKVTMGREKGVISTSARDEKNPKIPIQWPELHSH